MRLLALLFVFLGACSMPSRAYNLDGVPIMLEYNQGPSRQHMRRAAHTFRDAAREYFGLSQDEDLATWRRLTEIRWTASQLNDHVYHDFDNHMIYANWYGCALDVPLYVVLAEHYAGGHNDENEQWANELTEQSKATVCVTEPGWQLPDFGL